MKIRLMTILLNITQLNKKSYFKIIVILLINIEKNSIFSQSKNMIIKLANRDNIIRKIQKNSFICISYKLNIRKGIITSSLSRIIRYTSKSNSQYIKNNMLTIH
jgi:hypothetical protein